MPQGSYLGPLIFLVLINDFTVDCLLHKFMDDTTLSETIPKGASSNYGLSHYCVKYLDGLEII